MLAAAPLDPHSICLELALEIDRLATARWGHDRSTLIVGRDEELRRALSRIERFAASEAPVLITGETGTGKELFARALYLLSEPRREPMISVNCAQYQDGDMVTSQLFGHRQGSFTGASANHRGVFEEAHRGILFLDEIGELTPRAQAMLLRTLSEGEVVPLGCSRGTRVDVRVVAATSRDLRSLVEQGSFRSDLYYRLRQLSVVVPPVRARGGDWEIILRYYLHLVGASRGRPKYFSRDAMDMLRSYSWPGNVRELKSTVETGFHVSQREEICPEDFLESLEETARKHQLGEVPILDVVQDVYARMVTGGGTWWDLVHHPFLARELNRAEVRRVVARGLSESRGSYKRLLALFGIADQDYLKFMDFLRHHDLKPRS